MAHDDAREGKWRGNWRIEWVASTFTLPRNMVYPALLPLMRTPRLPLVDWTDAPTDLNGLVHFAEKNEICFLRVWHHISTGLYKGYVNTPLISCMGQSPSWEANRFPASQEIPLILWSPKVHYRFHNRPPLSVCSARSIQFMSTCHFLKVHCNITLPSTSGSSKWSSFLRSSHETPVHTSSFHHTCYMHRPPHSSWFRRPNIWWVMICAQANAPRCHVMRFCMANLLPVITVPVCWISHLE